MKILNMAMATHSTVFVLIFIAGELLVWLIALIDSFSLINNPGYRKQGDEIEEKVNLEETKTSNGNDVEDIDMTKILPNIKDEYIGFGLIGIGLLIFFQRVVYPLIATYMDWQFINNMQASIVALIFIIVGIKMLRKKKYEEIYYYEGRDGIK